MVMGAMMFGVGAKQKPPEKHSDQPLTANVRVSMDSFVVIPPYLAYDDIIDEAATKHGLDPDLIHAVIQTESEFNPLAVSPVGAQGLMQLMPEVQAELGVTDPFDPRENIMAGSEYPEEAPRPAQRRYRTDAGLVQRRAGERVEIQRGAAVQGNPRVRKKDQSPPRRVGG